MALSTEMMVRRNHLHDRHTKLSAEERHEYMRILWDFMEDFAAMTLRGSGVSTVILKS